LIAVFLIDAKQVFSLGYYLFWPLNRTGIFGFSVVSRLRIHSMFLLWLLFLSYVASQIPVVPSAYITSLHTEDPYYYEYLTEYADAKFGYRLDILDSSGGKVDRTYYILNTTNNHYISSLVYSTFNGTSYTTPLCLDTFDPYFEVFKRVWWDLGFYVGDGTYLNQPALSFSSPANYTWYQLEKSTEFQPLTITPISAYPQIISSFESKVPPPDTWDIPETCYRTFKPLSHSL